VKQKAHFIRHHAGRLALGMALTSCSVAWAVVPSSPNYVLQSSTLNAGGGDMASVNYKLSSSLGAPAFTSAMTSNGYRLRAGFWGFVDTTGFFSQADCLFNWAERNYPSLFDPLGAMSNTFVPYYYRYYSQTNTYLATSSADNHLYYLGPLSNNLVFDLGALSGWLTAAICQ
jgi:hypothetical protein